MRMNMLAGLAAGICILTSGSALAQTTAGGGTITPIKHLVVIFDENISFDHYFATYPNALNPEGEPAFTPAANTRV